MEKLKVVTGFFDKLRGDDDDTVYTEERILQVLEDLDLEQYGVVGDMPTKVVNEILTMVTEGLAARLDANQEQEMLDFFEEILVNGKVELPIMAKSLRYLLRTDKTEKAALGIIDVQNDFVSGALAVNEGEQIIEVINKMLETHSFHAVFYSLDWHPSNHCSFHSNVSLYPLHESSPCKAEDAKLFGNVIYDGEKVLEQVLWPDHCVQGSDGAKLHPELKVVEGAIEIRKGMLPHVDSYSAFWDNGKLSRSDMLAKLFDLGITHIFTCGLATDFCVGMTSVDAGEHGFDVYVVMDACRGVAEKTITSMTEKMSKAGCMFIQSCDVGEKMKNLK